MRRNFEERVPGKIHVSATSQMLIHYDIQKFSSKVEKDFEIDTKVVLTSKFPQSKKYFEMGT